VHNFTCPEGGCKIETNYFGDTQLTEKKDRVRIGTINR
jgi:hypothetical protein